MDNMNMAMGQQTIEAQSAGNAMARYGVYAESTKAKLADLQNAQEQLFMKLLNSNTINAVVTDLTNFVKELDFLTTSAPKSALALVGLSTAIILVIKNFKAMTLELIATGGEISIVDVFLKTFFGTAVSGAGALATLKGAFSALKASMSALFLTPAGLIFLGIASAIGIATLAITNHIQKQKELKEQTDANIESFKNLAKAISDADFNSQKTEVDKLSKQQQELQDLISKSKELKSQLDNTDPDSKGQYSKLASSLSDVNSKIQNMTKALKDSGFTVDENTGKVQELATAWKLVEINDTTDKIIQEADARKKQDQSIADLITRYEELANTQNKSSAQSKEMSNIAEQLADKNKDLKISIDEHGNAVIVNNGLLSKQKDALLLDIQTTDADTKAKINNAVNSMTYEYNNTTYTIQAVKDRISAYKAEVNSLQALNAAQSFNGSGVEYVDTKTQQMLSFWQNIEGSINSIYNKVGSTPSAPSISSPSSGGYVPSGGSGSSKSSSTKTDPLIAQEKAKLDAIQKLYDDFKTHTENTLKDLDLANSLLPSTDTADKIDILKQKLGLTNDELKQAEANLARLKGTSVSTTEAQDQLSKMINTATDEVRNQKQSVLDLSKSLDDLNLTSMKNIYDKSINGQTGFLADLDLKSKGIASNDNIGQMDILKQKYSAIKDEIKNTEAYLNNLSHTTANTKEGQDSLNKAYADGIDKLRGYESSLVDTNNSMQQMAEKILESSIEKSIYGGQTQSEWENGQTARVNSLQNALDLLNKQNDAQQTANDLLDKYNQITQDQIDLNNILNNKNIQILKQQADGSWNYDYTYDASAYKSAQDKLVKDNDTYNKQVLTNQKKAQTDAIQSQIDAINKETSIRKTALDTIRANLQTALGNGATLTDPTTVTGIVSTSMTTISKLFGDKFASIISDIQSKLSSISVPSYSGVPSSGGGTTTNNSNTGSNGLPSSDWRSQLNGNLSHDSAIIAANTGTPQYADGTDNASGGMSLTSEHGAELRILNQGDGIIPSDITKTLMNFGKSPMSFLQSLVPNISIPNFSKTASSNNPSLSLHIDNLNLPDVKNPNEFISGIKNLAIQKLNTAYGV